MAGAFIVIEGPDGTGKTTLANNLYERLRDAGFDVVRVREPGGTPTAEAARRAVLDPDLEASPLAELFLFLAARADLVHRVIRPALAAGKIVLGDRFDLSTTAYQVAGRGLPADAVTDANRLATGGLKPDLVLVLDAPVEVIRGRQAREGKTVDRMENADRDMHERVWHAFRAVRGQGIVHVDATGSAATVSDAAWRAVRVTLNGTP